MKPKPTKQTKEKWEDAIEFAQKYNQHLKDEGKGEELTSYELGHLAVFFRDFIRQLLDSQREEIKMEIVSLNQRERFRLKLILDDLKRYNCGKHLRLEKTINYLLKQTPPANRLELEQ